MIFVFFGFLTIVTRTALVFFGPVTTSSVVNAALEGLRLATVLTIFGTFNAVSDPFGVLRLAPRRFHEPALAAALALSLAPRTIEAASRVREAQKMRGIEMSRLRALPALAVPVLATGMEEATTLAESMDARGHGRGRRTRYRPQPWTAWSIVTALAALVAVVIVFSASRDGWGALAMSTSPLEVPDVSMVIVPAILLLAIPAFRGTR